MRATTNIAAPKLRRKGFAGGLGYDITESLLSRIIDDIIRDNATDHLETLAADEAVECGVCRTLTPSEIKLLANQVFTGCEEAFWEVARAFNLPVHPEGIQEVVEGTDWDWGEAIIDCDLGGE